MGGSMGKKGPTHKRSKTSQKRHHEPTRNVRTGNDEGLRLQAKKCGYKNMFDALLTEDDMKRIKATENIENSLRIPNLEDGKERSLDAMVRQQALDRLAERLTGKSLEELCTKQYKPSIWSSESRLSGHQRLVKSPS